MNPTRLAFMLVITFARADYRPSPDYDSGDILSSISSTMEHLLRNDELECLPRLFCEQAAGGKPGQARAINIDIASLFKLLQYLGLDQSNKDNSPMVSLLKAATMGLTHRGDSYECYRQYPRCPRDETRLLYYLNNHRGGFFRGFSGYYNRNYPSKLVKSESRIVNNANRNNFEKTRDQISANDFFVPETPSFVFSNDFRKPKDLKHYGGTDRLPNRLYFPEADEGSPLAFPHTFNELGSSFFPQE